MEQNPQTQERERRMASSLCSSTRSAFTEALRAYILFRLSLPEDTRERSLYRLVVYSVKLRMPGTDARQLEERLATTDCHQTSYVVSRKNLLMMEIERGLNIRLSPEALDRIVTTEDYADALWETMSHD